jgi:hypothetical protein
MWESRSDTEPIGELPNVRLIVYRNRRHSCTSSLGETRLRVELQPRRTGQAETDGTRKNKGPRGRDSVPWSSYLVQHRRLRRVLEFFMIEQLLSRDMISD